MAKNNPARDAFEVFLEAKELDYSGPVGTLYRDKARTALPPSFEYTAEWIAQQLFMLDPRLELYAGEQHPVGDSFSFGVFLDCKGNSLVSECFLYAVAFLAYNDYNLVGF